MGMTPSQKRDAHCSLPQLQLVMCSTLWQSQFRPKKRQLSSKAGTLLFPKQPQALGLPYLVLDEGAGPRDSQCLKPLQPRRAGAAEGTPSTAAPHSSPLPSLPAAAPAAGSPDSQVSLRLEQPPTRWLRGSHQHWLFIVGVRSEVWRHTFET